MLKLLTLKKFNSLEEITRELEKITLQDYTRLDLCSNTIEEFKILFAKLNDAEDFIPKNNLKKMRSMIFRLFKKQFKKDNKACKYYYALNKLKENKKWHFLETQENLQEEQVITVEEEQVITVEEEQQPLNEELQEKVKQ